MFDVGLDEFFHVLDVVVEHWQEAYWASWLAEKSFADLWEQNVEESLKVACWRKTVAAD